MKTSVTASDHIGTTQDQHISGMSQFTSNQINPMPTKPKPDAADKGAKKNAPKNEAKGGKKDDKKGA